MMTGCSPENLICPELAAARNSWTLPGLPVDSEHQGDSSESRTRKSCESLAPTGASQTLLPLLAHLSSKSKFRHFLDWTVLLFADWCFCHGTPGAAFFSFFLSRTGSTSGYPTNRTPDRFSFLADMEFPISFVLFSTAGGSGRGHLDTGHALNRQSSTQRPGWAAHFLMDGARATCHSETTDMVAPYSRCDGRCLLHATAGACGISDNLDNTLPGF